VWNRRLPPLTPVAAVSLQAVGAPWCAPSRFDPEPSVVTAINAIRGAVCRGNGVVILASVGMRTETGAATAWGCHLAGQILNLLEQTSGVGGFGDR